MYLCYQCITVAAVSALPDILPGYSTKAGETSRVPLADRSEALSVAAEVLAALLSCCAEEAHAAVAPVVFLLLLNMIATSDARLTAAATRALQQAVQSAKEPETLKSACAYALNRLQETLCTSVDRRFCLLMEIHHFHFLLGGCL